MERLYALCMKFYMTYALKNKTCIHNLYGFYLFFAKTSNFKDIFCRYSFIPHLLYSNRNSLLCLACFLLCITCFLLCHPCIFTLAHYLALHILKFNKNGILILHLLSYLRFHYDRTQTADQITIFSWVIGFVYVLDMVSFVY